MVFPAGVLTKICIIAAASMAVAKNRSKATAGNSARTGFRMLLNVLMENCLWK